MKSVQIEVVYYQRFQERTWIKRVHRRGAEIAEETQRLSQIPASFSLRFLRDLCASAVNLLSQPKTIDPIGF